MKRYRYFRGKLREHAEGEWVRYAYVERLCDARDMASKVLDAYARHPESLAYAMQRLARAVEAAP